MVGGMEDGGTRILGKQVSGAVQLDGVGEK
jgi:hypothetical protein